MVRVTRRFITEEARDAFALVQRLDPSDEEITQFIRDHYAHVDLEENQIFQIFELLVGRDPQFENNRNVPQFRNLVADDPVLNPQPQPPVEQQQQPPVDPQPQQPPVRQRNMAAAAQFVDDPFKGNINPGTSDGAKLYLKATASTKEDDKIEINITSAQKFVDMVTKDTNNFGWGSLVRAIPFDVAGATKNLLIEHRDIDFAMIKKQAYKTWGNHQADFDTIVPENQELEELDPAAIEAHRVPFYRRVRSRMIAKRIIGYLKLSDWEHLKNKSSKFTWSGHGDEEMDGPTILWVLLQTCNPSTRVGVSELKEDIRGATSAKFGHDIQKLTDFVSSKYREIREKGQTHEDIILDLFNAFKTVPNPDFEAHVRDERKLWELGGEKDVDQIISEALVIYNNAITANRWQTKDPKDAKILALQTQVEQLVGLHQQSLKANTTQAPQTNRSTPRQQFTEIADWRMKKGQEQLDRDGKTWFWCPHHKMEGKYNGLYVTHKPEDHGEWQKRKDERNAKKRKPKEEQSNSGPHKSEDGSNKLVISDSLKAALMTHMDISPEQIDAMVRDADDSEDF